MSIRYMALLSALALATACTPPTTDTISDGGTGTDAGSSVDAGHECPTGYTGASCDQDIDECAAATNPCAVTEDCTNTPGSYSCAPKFLALSSGADHSCVIRGDHSLWCWGSNRSGQIGDGTTETRSAPVQVGADKNWAAVDARGDASTFALKVDGSLWSWGTNYDGQLGLGHTDDVKVPTQVGTEKSWRAVAASIWWSHACALKADDSLWCWGNNEDGQLGDGTTESKLVPTQIGTDKDWDSIAGGDGWTCVLKKDHSLWCTGYNRNGQLGDGTTTTRHAFQQVGTDTDWAAAQSGDSHICALKTDGSLWCWGSNYEGQAGSASFDDNVLTPTQFGTDKDWAAVAIGGEHSCALKKDGTAWCWGGNDNRQLGNGGALSSATPSLVTGEHHWLDLSAGGQTSCGVSSDGALMCWGTDADFFFYGALGTNAPSYVPTPTAIAGNDWVSVHAGYNHACAMQKDQTLWCWGKETGVDLGSGYAANTDAPTVVDASAHWLSYAAGYWGSCGIKTDGTLWCWGQNTFSLLARDNTIGASVVPLQVGTANDWRQVGVDGSRACALNTKGEIWCWGGPSANVLVQMNGGPWTSISSDTTNLYAIHQDGTLWAYPWNKADATQVSTDTDWAFVTSSSASRCGRKTSGALYCWGSNENGQLGTGDTQNVDAPMEIAAGTKWKSIDMVINRHNDYYTAKTCGVQTNGTLWCWGRDDQGGIGFGREVRTNTPTQLGESTLWTSVSVGETTGYAVRSDGTLWGWGYGAESQLGLGGAILSTPKVVLP